MALNNDPPINLSDALCAEYDLQLLLQNLLQHLLLQINYKWVKAHQNELLATKETIYDPFQRHVQLNI